MGRTRLLWPSRCSGVGTPFHLPRVKTCLSSPPPKRAHRFFCLASRRHCDPDTSEATGVRFAGGLNDPRRRRADHQKISSYCKRCIEMAPRVVELSLPPDAIHIPGTSRVIADRLSRVYAPSGNGAVDETSQPDFSSCDTHGSDGYERQLVQGL